jgi:hypothetical protein
MPNPALLLQLFDKRRELVRVSLLPSFASINMQTGNKGRASIGGNGAHVLSEEGEDEHEEMMSPLQESAPVIQGDGCDKLLEYRCSRYALMLCVRVRVFVHAVPVLWQKT